MQRKGSSYMILQKKMYETDCMGFVHSYNFDLRELGETSYKTHKVVDKTELLEVLKRQIKKQGRYFERK